MALGPEAWGLGGGGWRGRWGPEGSRQPGGWPLEMSQQQGCSVLLRQDGRAAGPDRPQRSSWGDIVFQVLNKQLPGEAGPV